MDTIEIRKRRIGRTALEVTELGFGASAIGGRPLAAAASPCPLRSESLASLLFDTVRPESLKRNPSLFDWPLPEPEFARFEEWRGSSAEMRT